ncbi:lariat debranching enzyme, partial [Coelomomyces lativittatus]
ALRNEADLVNINVPPKYKRLGDFYAYYSGEKIAPYLTVFIGGNHESSAYLWELYYGGWVAPKIYYLGWANVIRIGTLKLGGISGIYKPQSYQRHHLEVSPYNPSDIRSIYHLRKEEIQLLSTYTSPIDIFLSHDWPRHIAYHGDTQKLLAMKSFFKEDIASGNLGAPPLQHLLYHLKPTYWFSAHLHVKFPALVPHVFKRNTSEYDLDGFSHLPDSREILTTQPLHQTPVTKFLALDKCLPKRDFIQFLDLPFDMGPFYYDADWLAILRAAKNHSTFDKELTWVHSHVTDFMIPSNFCVTSPIHPISDPQWTYLAQLPQLNPQTTRFCDLIQLPNTINHEGITLTNYSQ